MLKILRYLAFSLLFFASYFIKCSHVEPSKEELETEYKSMLMFMTEPLISGGKINGKEIEGAKITEMSTYLLKSIESVVSLQSPSSTIDLKKLKTFKVALEKGSQITQSIFNALNQIKKNILENSVPIQEELLKAINESPGSWIYVPAGWIGKNPHAVVLGFRKNSNKTYNLAVMNTGNGVEYHRSIQDPNGVYTFITQVWMEFKNIPNDEIFDQGAWFIKALLLINHTEYVSKIEPASLYFYGTILSNFRKYLDNSESAFNHDLFLTVQRSGSCTMSSILAALLHHCQDKSQYYLFRLILGQRIGENFLERVAHGNFGELINDGFDLFGRKIFKSVASGLADFASQYLEEAHNAHFKNAILLGIGKADWLRTKKDSALQALQSDKDSLNLIESVVQLGIKIFNALKTHKIDPKTTEIEFKGFKSLKKRYIPIIVSSMLTDLNVNDFLITSTSPYEYLSGPASKLGTPLSIRELASRLNECARSGDSSMLGCASDAFNRVGPEWWLKIDKISSPEIARGLLLVISGLVKACANISIKKKKSLDEILLFASLQLAAWRSAQAFDRLFGNRLDLSKFSPPYAIQESIEDMQFFSGMNYRSKVVSNFNAANLYLLRQVYAELDIKSGLPRFAGPRELLKSSNYSTIKFEEFANLDHKNKEVYEKIKSSSEFKAVFDFVLTGPKNSKVGSDKNGKLAVLFTEMNRLSGSFPQFIELMQVNIFIYLVLARDTPKNIDIGANYEDLNVIGVVTSSHNSRSESDYDFVSSSSDMSTTLPVLSKILFDSGMKSENLFITSCQSSAFDGSANIINFETWLNNVKGALDSEIFADAHFMYISNRLLTIPSIVFRNGRISLCPTETYPFGFEKRHVLEVYDAMFALVHQDTKRLISRPAHMTQSQVNDLVLKSSTIGLLLSRFIERLENDKYISGSSVSEMLSKLYMLFSPLAQFKNKKLSDMNTSIFNLVLTHICSFDLRNSREFYENIVVGSSNVKFTPSFRRSLARVHYFLSQLNYIANQKDIRGTRTSTNPESNKKEKYTKASLIDDMFQVGFPFYPIDGVEADFTSELLKILFLKNYAPSTEFISFKYAANGDLVEMTSNSSSNLKIAIQISNGRMAVNDIPIASKNSIISSSTFREIFITPDDKFYASMGEAFRMGRNTVYLLKNFRNRGINFFFARSDSSAPNDCHAFRQWNGKWYLYRSRDSLKFHLEYIGLTDSPYVKYSMYQKSSKETVDHEEYGEVIVERHENVILDLETNQDPIYRINFNNCGCMDNPIELRIGHFDLECELVKSKLSSTPFNVSKHVMSFSGSRAVGICQRAITDTVVFILPTFQVHTNQVLPLTMVENQDGELNILNLPGYVVEKAQTINAEIGISGTLRVRNKDGESFLMVPAASKSDLETVPVENSYLKISKTIIVEFIPILNEAVSPQTRFHRLLLAFYAADAFEFDLSRELLHPIVSMHQNEVFSLKEIAIIEWFSLLTSKVPEITALKAFVYTHLYINRLRFPLEYSPGGSRSTAEVIEAIEKIDENIEATMLNYMLIVRNLPDKFNMPKVFSELRNRVVFDAVYGNIKSFSEVPSVEDAKDFNMHEYCRSKLDFERYQDAWTDEASALLLNLTLNLRTFYEMFKKTNSTNMPNIKAFSKIGRRIILDKLKLKRQKVSSEMAFYCVVKDPTMWNGFKNALDVAFSTTKGGPLNSSELCIVSQKFSEVVKACAEKYSSDFELASQAKSFKIDLNLTYNALVGDSEGYREVQVDLDGLNFNLVSIEDIREFQIVISALEAFKSKAVARSPASKEYFDYLSASLVLKKLKKSIEDFIHKNGESTATILNCEKEPGLIDSIQSFNAFLTDKITALKQSLNEMAYALVDKTRLNSSNDARSDHEVSAKSFDYISQLMHSKKSKTFSSLYSCYQSGHVECFQKKFPGLSTVECNDLRLQTAKFYSIGVLEKYFAFVLSKTKDLLLPENRITSVEIITILLDELSKIHDFNERVKNQTILNFEFRSEKYRLKPEQVSDVTLLTSKDPKTGMYKSTVIQRMMAAGKTLVLGTISIVRKAMKGDTLSILVPPSSLYQSNTSAMQIRTYLYFKRKGNTFHFPRFPVSNEDSVQVNFMSFVLKLITNTMKERNYMILSPDTLHSFLNSYIESLDRSVSVDWTKEPQTETKLRLFAEIYKVFREKSSMILDEIDMTLDPRKELNFPTVDREPYNMTAAILVADLLEFAVFDREVLDNGLDIHGNNQAKLSKAQGEIIKAIFLRYIESQLADKSSIWNSLILKSLEPDHLKSADIMKFLRTDDMSYGVQWINEVAKAEDLVLAHALVIVKVELHRYLFESFKSTANLNYGLPGLNRSDKHYSVPYLAANTPSPSSEFADRWETLNKTLLSFASTSCSKNVVESVIKYISDTIAKESSEKVLPHLTTSFKNISALLPEGINPLTLRDDDSRDVELLLDFLKSRSPAAVRILFSYCIDVVFAGMDFATEQVTSNALNMTSMFGSVQGYSGTIDNVNILPQNVLKEAYADHLENEKNNGGIALKLLKDSKMRNVPELGDHEFCSDAKEFVENILRKFSHVVDVSTVSAIIDAGAFFKNFNNLQIARAILDIRSPGIKAVLYYNETSNQLEFVRKSEGNYLEGYLSNTDPDAISKTTQTNLDERFTFYDHRHITGSDILQPRMAQAILTIGTRILLRDILQGTLRMRQFMTSQVVHFITSAAAKQFYYSKVEPSLTLAQVSAKSAKVSDMLALGALNEDEKQLFENEKLAFVKIDNEVRSFVLDEISLIINSKLLDSSKTRTLLSSWFQKNRHLFVRLIKENPFQWLKSQELQDSKTVLSNYIESRMAIIKAAFSEVKDQYTGIAALAKYDERFKSMNQRLDEMILDDRTKVGSLLYFLKDTINAKANDSSQGSEVEMQLDVNILVDLNLDVLIQTFSTIPPAKVHPKFTVTELEKTKGTELTLNTIFVGLASILQDPKFDEKRKPLTTRALLTSGKQVGVSLDLVDLLDEPAQRPFKIFSKYTLAATHLLVEVIREKKGVRVLLLSLKAAKDLHIEISTNLPTSTTSTFWLCDLSGRVSTTNDTQSKVGMNVLDFIPASRLLIFDALIFNGSMSQIISSKYLYDLYLKHWLNDNSSFVQRATFLLLRMKVLFDKTVNCMETNNEHLILLEKLARGDVSALAIVLKHEATSNTNASNYQKPPIRPEYEAQVCTERAIKKESLIERDDVTKRTSAGSLTFNGVFESIFGKIDPQNVVNTAISFVLNRGLLVPDNNSDPSADSFVAVKKELEFPVILWLKVSGCPEESQYSDNSGGSKLNPHSSSKPASAPSAPTSKPAPGPSSSKPASGAPAYGGNKRRKKKDKDSSNESESESDSDSDSSKSSIASKKKSKKTKKPSTRSTNDAPSSSSSLTKTTVDANNKKQTQNSTMESKKASPKSNKNQLSMGVIIVLASFVILIPSLGLALYLSKRKAAAIVVKNAISEKS